MATVLANQLVWDNHASPAGVGALLLCLIGASAYTPAPLRSDKGSLEAGGGLDKGRSQRCGFAPLIIGVAGIVTTSALVRASLGGATAFGSAPAATGPVTPAGAVQAHAP